jgi:hypothetical protein
MAWAGFRKKIRLIKKARAIPWLSYHKDIMTLMLKRLNVADVGNSVGVG